MIEHDSASSTSEQGGLESRFIPGARIEARDISAINVVSGVQNIADQQGDFKVPKEETKESFFARMRKTSTSRSREE